MAIFIVLPKSLPAFTQAAKAVYGLHDAIASNDKRVLYRIPEPFFGYGCVPRAVRMESVNEAVEKLVLRLAPLFTLTVDTNSCFIDTDDLLNKHTAIPSSPEELEGAVLEACSAPSFSNNAGIRPEVVQDLLAKINVMQNNAVQLAQQLQSIQGGFNQPNIMGGSQYGMFGQQPVYGVVNPNHQCESGFYPFGQQRQYANSGYGMREGVFRQHQPKPRFAKEVQSTEEKLVLGKFASDVKPDENSGLIVLTKDSDALIFDDLFHSTNNNIAQYKAFAAAAVNQIKCVDDGLWLEHNHSESGKMLTPIDKVLLCPDRNAKDLNEAFYLLSNAYQQIEEGLEKGHLLDITGQWLAKTDSKPNEETPKVPVWDKEEFLIVKIPQDAIGFESGLMHCAALDPNDNTKGLLVIPKCNFIVVGGQSMILPLKEGFPVVKLNEYTLSKNFKFTDEVKEKYPRIATVLESQDGSFSLIDNLGKEIVDFLERNK